MSIGAQQIKHFLKRDHNTHTHTHIHTHTHTDRERESGIKHALQCIARTRSSGICLTSAED